MALLLYTADEVMAKGLLIVGFSATRLAGVMRKTRLAWFESHFGVAPVVYSEIWEDLQTPAIAEARIDTKKRGVTIDNFLQSIYFIKVYPTEIQRSALSGYSDRTDRKWGWYFLGKIAALKGLKVLCHRSTLLGLLLILKINPLIICSVFL